MNNHSLGYLIGMTEDAALRTLYDADIPYRVTFRDNLLTLLNTVSVVEDRVNLEIMDNKVFKAYYG